MGGGGGLRPIIMIGTLAVLIWLASYFVGYRRLKRSAQELARRIGIGRFGVKLLAPQHAPAFPAGRRYLAFFIPWFSTEHSGHRVSYCHAHHSASRRLGAMHALEVTHRAEIPLGGGLYFGFSPKFLEAKERVAPRVTSPDERVAVLSKHPEQVGTLLGRSEVRAALERLIERLAPYGEEARLLVDERRVVAALPRIEELTEGLFDEMVRLSEALEAGSR